MRRMMFFVAIVQFALATGHAITIVVQLVRGFGQKSIDTQYLLNQATPEHLAQEFFYITNSLVGDAILIWRLWAIWGHKHWLTGPFVLLCVGTAVTGYTAIINLSQLSPTEPVFVPRVHSWLIATWCLSIATQFGATLLIGYRFRKSIRWNSTQNGTCKSRLDILWIIVESGALYSVTTIFLLGFSFSNTGALFASALGQISALAPTLIIVRAGLRGSLSSLPFTPVKGSINNDSGTQQQPLTRITNREMGQCKSRHEASDTATVVHINKATEVRLRDLMRNDGDSTASSDGSSGSSKLQGYPSEFLDV